MIKYLSTIDDKYYFILQTKFNIPERGKKAVFSRINDAWR